MNVVKNKNFKENHDKLQEDVKKYSNSLIDIYDKMEAFYVVIKTLKETFLIYIIHLKKLIKYLKVLLNN